MSDKQSAKRRSVRLCAWQIVVPHGTRPYRAPRASALVLGVWALHRAWDDGARAWAGREWTVSHVPSGFRFSDRTRRRDALALFRRLYETWPDWQAGTAFGVGPPVTDAMRELRDYPEARR